MPAPAHPRHLTLLALAIAGCAGGNETRIQLEIADDPSAGIDNFQVHVGTKTALTPATTTLDLEVPDDLSGQPQIVQLWGLSAGQQVAYGTTTVTPQRHTTVSTALRLSPVSCGPVCTDGDVECVGDGTAICEVDDTGCLGWSAVTPCPATAPDCEDGTCSATCSDECALGATECDGSNAQRTCGRIDSTCLVWSAPMACLTGQTCTTNACGTTCSGDGTPCDDSNPCTVNDTCEHSTCSGTPKCTTAPANSDPTCASDGTCGFSCHADFAPSGSVCAPAAVASLTTSRGYPATVLGPDGLIYAFGGATGTNILLPVTPLATVEAYTPSTNTWAAKAAMSAARDEAGAAVAANGLIYVIGGYDGTNYLGTVEAYNPATNTWATKTAMPTPRARLAVVIGADHIIYAIGGEIAGASASMPGQTGVVEAYDPSTDKWTTKTPDPTPREATGAALGPDGQIYVIGGLAGTTTLTQLTTVEAFKPSGNSWSTVASLTTAIDDLAAVTGPDGQIYAVGGFNGQAAVATLNAYSTTANAWTAKAAMPRAHSDHGAVATPTLLYAIGGFDPTVDTSTTAVDAYSFADNVW